MRVIHTERRGEIRERERIFYLLLSAGPFPNGCDDGLSQAAGHWVGSESVRT